MPEQHIDNIITSFDPIALDEMDSVKLMNRVDTKFVITRQQLIQILPQLRDDYRMLEIKGLRTPQYESEYYDSKSFGFYIDHHRKKINRFKVRFRKYVESNLVFLEVKHKNCGRTDKKRIMVDSLPGKIVGDHSDFIASTGAAKTIR